MTTAVVPHSKGFSFAREPFEVWPPLSRYLNLFDLLQEEVQPARNLRFSGQEKEAALWLHAHLCQRLKGMHPERPASNGALQRAQELLNNRVRLLNSSLVHIGEPLGTPGVNWLAESERDLQWTAHLGYFYWAHDLAVAYARTGDEAYAEKWLVFVEDFLENVPRGSPLVDYVPSRPMVQNWQTACDNGESSPASPALWISLAAAWRMDVWLDGLILLADSRTLTPERLFRILHSLSGEHYLCLVDNPRQNTPNQFVHTSKALLRLGLTLPELQIGSSAFFLGYARLQEAIAMQVFPDGSDLEQSPNYNANLMRALEETLLLLEQAGAPPQRTEFFQTTAKRRAHWILNACRPDGKMHDIAKAHAQPMRGDLEKWSRRLNLPEIFWAVTSGCEGQPPTYLSVAFPFGGYYVLRDSWIENATQLFFKASKRGRGHAHEDALSFILHAHGEPLLIDSGHFSYTDQHEPDRGMNRYCESSWSHSTAIVDGWGQQRKWLWKKTDPDWRINFIPLESAAESQPLSNRTAQGKYFEFIEGQYTDGYAPDYFPTDPMGELLGLVAGTRSDDEIVCSHRRQILWVKGRGFLIFDHFIPDDWQEHHFTQLWQFAPHLDAEIGEKSVRASGKVGLDLVFGSFVPLNIAAFRGEDAPSRGWYCPEYKQRVSKADVHVTWQGIGPQLALTWVQPVTNEIENRVAEVQSQHEKGEWRFTILWTNGECWVGRAANGGATIFLTTGDGTFELEPGGAIERDTERRVLKPLPWVDEDGSTS